MADSNVAITAGSGTSIDTRTEATNGNHRQVVVLGDPSTNAGVAPVDATNGLKVDVSNSSLTVDLGANNDVTVTGDALTALQLIDDIVKTDDAAFTPATDKVAMVGAEFDDTTPDSVDEGDAGALRMSSRRELYSQIRDAAGNERGANVDASNQLLVAEANSTAILADTANMDTNLGTVAGAVSGSEMQVDVVASLPAGTNAIGKLAANSGVDIGDVDVTSLDGVAAEAAALGNGILIQGDDGTDRKNINVDATTGDVQVDVTNTVTVSGTVTANLSSTDNTVLDTIETNTDFGTVTGGGTETGALRVTIANNSTGVVSVDDNGGALTVDASQLDIDDLAPTSDGVGAALDTSQIMNGTTSLTPKYAVIDAATSGDNTLVSAVSSKKIRVLACFMVAAGDLTARFEDGASGTALTGQMNLTTNSGFVLPFNPVGWFETSATTLLNLELSAATSVDGSLVYVEV